MSIRIHPPRPASSRSAADAPQYPRNAALKSFACGVAALAVTALFGWSFVHTTSMERAGGGTLAALSAAAMDVVGQAR